MASGAASACSRAGRMMRRVVTGRRHAGNLHAALRLRSPRARSTVHPPYWVAHLCAGAAHAADPGPGTPGQRRPRGAAGGQRHAFRGAGARAGWPGPAPRHGAALAAGGAARPAGADRDPRAPPAPDRGGGPAACGGQGALLREARVPRRLRHAARGQGDHRPRQPRDRVRRGEVARLSSPRAALAHERAGGYRPRPDRVCRWPARARSVHAGPVPGA